LLVVTLLPLTITGCASSPTRASTGEYIDDSTITTKITAKYAKDPVVSAMQVNVETYKGVVQLSGFVNHEHAKMRAEEIARGTAGVTKVQNNIIVK
jgi:osmotically-inducible protein OsmY